MTDKKKQVLENLKEKLGDKLFNKALIIAKERFGNKENLKNKFYQSILDNFINIKDLWTDDNTIESLVKIIDSKSDEDKEKVILEIIDTYDTKDPKIKELLRKYNRVLKKLKTENFDEQTILMK